MPTYSHSRLATFENCPQQYKLKYIDKVKLPDGEEEGIEAFLGSRVHEVLEKLHKELILAKLNSIDELLTYYAEIWDKNWHKNVFIRKQGFTKANYRLAGKEAIENYYRRYHPFKHDKTLSTEQLITFKLGDYAIQGYIDRLSRAKDGAYEIHDYKTSGTLPAQAKFDTDRQLALYQIGIREKYRDANDIRLIWHYLLFDQTFTSLRTPAQLKDLQKEVVSLIRQVEKETKFEPSESKLCDWCEYPAFCPAKKHEISVASMPANKYLKNKGVTLVTKYAEIKAQIAELQAKEKGLDEELALLEEAAIEYAKQHELTSISGSDYSLKLTESVSLSFPRSGDAERAALEKYLKKSGIWEDVSGLNVSRLKKLIDDGTLAERTRDNVIRFAEEVNEVKVKLIRKRHSDA